ncbi:LysR family transcriptional regulator [Accumulibacter sp.]|uniref:LysR family transcriptional regulator n=1 Tax=Accumulibacter sp. TaxID=2053492 RepID=UPI0025D5FB8C|nr:LysR family transcriptional regulator [Accumulibacter sp.]MCM8594736.1 LysR family transcriptional regulator [Accumulibacter sp.]MCM8625847.1 LysR family transcriptional regulator [Accumulibacter sp.]MDS4048882.1 LysR family transcriptional regulator [Accumulibacter sp.]
MHGLQQLIAFAETAKHGSFAAAARELGTAPSTLAKAVARLEASLGVKLFHRTTRQVRPTADGERLFERCQRVLAEVEALQSEAAGTRGAPAGLLRVDLPIVYGRRVLLPVLARLVERYPALQLDLRLHDSYTDLIRDGIDLAVRVGTLGDSRLVARRFAEQVLVLCASPAYLGEHGPPQTIDDLATHRAIVHRLPTSGRLRSWVLASAGRRIDVDPPSRVQINDGDGVVAAACLGLGLAQVPDYMVADEIAGGRLVEVLPSLRPPAEPISVVYPSGRLVPPRVRVVIDSLLSLGVVSDGASPATDR